MQKYCYFNGKIVQSDKPHLFLDDIGVLRGFGAFDFFRVYDSKPFFLKDHYRRFQKSAVLLELRIPISLKKLEGVIQELLRKNKMQHAHVRMVLTGGRTRENILPSKENFYILLDELQDLPQQLYKQGASLMVAEHQRLLPEAKTTNYLRAVQLQKARKKAGAVEILYTYRGTVLEATTSNIFLVKKGKLITPQENILHGVTRKIVIDLAQNRGIPVVERKVREKELYDADEVFLTATNKKVLPIVRINKKKVATGKVGGVTTVLLDDFTRLLKAQ